ncbi:hypothetical protein M5362_17965 [Streptomyces sp. Je 1-79]|uniref:HEAT repeat domain-containing protein n=1 Tax=Streptomyces sp. Je 1-79 TaxID=2943847 RepID=UPI0021A687EF|nr:HEAT repeat domain-containing protein [Streptomyces sp. Je 1-79]MCT4355018.1 hypothetical protein [Streptomyces sp. Je 1-79]
MNTDALAGLDALDWAALRHAYGSAEDVPVMLRDLYRPEKAAQASDTLLTHVHHQGGEICSSAPPVLPYVLRAAADPRVAPAVRRELVEFVGALARSANTARPQHVDPAWPAAWDQAVTLLLPRLVAPEAAIRRAVAEGLAEARHRADEVLTALRARWEVDPDPDTRHQLVDSVGALTPYAEEQREASLGWLRGLTGGGVPAARLAAVKALHTALRGRPDDAYARTVSEVLLGTDPAAWHPDAAHVEWTVLRTVGLLDADPAEQIAAIRNLLAHPDAGVRTGALKAAAEAISRRRSAVPALLPAVARLLSDPEPGHRLFAARFLGMCGHAARPWADALAAMVTDEGEPHPPAQDHAVWALSRLGDARCVPPLVERLAGERLGFADHGTHADGWWTYELGLVETAGGLAAHADVLLPPLRSRLAAASSLGERRALCRLLERWGPAAAPAIPELLALLDTDCAVWALDALAAIGPAAAAAVPRERLRALLPPPSEGWSFEGPALARAYGRLTGDREPALAHLLPRLDAPYGLDDAVTLLGELGPAGAPYVPRLRALLTRHRTSWLPLRVGAALWRITGETHEVVPVLIGAIEPFAGGGGKATRAVTETIRLLGEIGPPAVEAVPLLRRYLDADERPVPHGGWRSVPDDDELCAAARAALLAVRGGRSPQG